MIGAVSRAPSPKPPTTTLTVAPSPLPILSTVILDVYKRQHLALAFAQNRQRKLKLPAYVPVLLFLREHIKTIVGKEPPHLAELVQAHFANVKLSLIHI